MKILKNIVLIVVSLISAYFTAEWFGVLYEKFFGPQGGGFFVFSLNDLDARFLVGIVPAFVAYTSFLSTAFGGKGKYWWTGILLLPVVWFVWKFDLAHWYFYVGLAVAGWIIGWLISKLFSRFRK